MSFTPRTHLAPHLVLNINLKKKFVKKVVLYIVISEQGVSEPFFLTSGLAVNQEVYEKQCLKKHLVPFIKKYYQDGNFVFWPDKASSHYAKKTVEFLNKENITFVPKEHNPTNLPQCRPVEDFFGELSSLVYNKGWRAKTTKQLKTRIRKCLREMDTIGVQTACSNIARKLRAVADNGPYSQNH